MLIFDFDGTLVDSNGVWDQIDRDFLDARGLAMTGEYHDFVAHTTFPIAARFTREYYSLQESEEEIMSAWLSAAHEAYAHHIPLKPFALEYLMQCRADGERMVLFTAGRAELCLSCCARLGLEEYFERVVFAQDMGLEKRDPRAFLRLAQLLDMPPEECTVFEDSLGNCKGASAAGMHTVGVYDAPFAKDEAELRRVCSRYIMSFSELLRPQA